MTTTETLLLDISVGVRALQRYPAGCSTMIKTTMDKFLLCLYVHVH